MLVDGVAGENPKGGLAPFFLCYSEIRECSETSVLILYVFRVSKELMQMFTTEKKEKKVSWHVKRPLCS